MVQESEITEAIYLLQGIHTDIERVKGDVGSIMSSSAPSVQSDFDDPDKIRSLSSLSGEVMKLTFSVYDIKNCFAQNQASMVKLAGAVLTLTEAVSRLSGLKLDHLLAIQNKERARARNDAKRDEAELMSPMV